MPNTQIEDKNQGRVKENSTQIQHQTFDKNSGICLISKFLFPRTESQKMNLKACTYLESEYPLLPNEVWDFLKNEFASERFYI